MFGDPYAGRFCHLERVARDYLSAHLGPKKVSLATVCSLGRCLGCTRMARLDDGVCIGCLAHPGDGRRWARLRHRARTEPEFARACYDRIKDPAKRANFREMFGDPYARVRTNVILVDEELES